MKEMITMWRYPKMIVLMGASALLYTITLVPFKGFVLIPGVAELRPAAVFPPLLGILFGPAGAWGCAIGNTLGDLLGGTLTKGSLFGFVGNFCYATCAYYIWSKFHNRDLRIEFQLNNTRDLWHYVSSCMLASAAVASIIGWGLEMFRMTPFAAVGAVILINNLVASIVLGPFLFKLFHSRMRAWNLLWTDVLPPNERPRGSDPELGVRMMWIGSVGALIAGLVVSHMVYGNPFLEVAGDPAMGTGVVMGTGAFLIVFFIGLFLA